LALAPGRREFGVAVFGGAELVYFSIREIKGRRSKKLIKRQVVEIVSELYGTFEPDHIAIKAISKYQSSSDTLASLIGTVKYQARLRRIPTTEVSIKEIMDQLCPSGRATLKKAFQTLTVIYPELSQFWNRPNRWQNDYYYNLFTAVAVGAVRVKMTNKKSQNSSFPFKKNEQRTKSTNR
jgi:hypothetical protein